MLCSSSQFCFHYAHATMPQKDSTCVYSETLSVYYCTHNTCSIDTIGHAHGL